MPNTSYYLYQKWEQRGEQDWIPAYPNEYSIDGNGTMPLSAKTVHDPACGYIPPSEPIYRWVNLDPSIDWVCDEAPTPTPIYRWQDSGYTCVGYDKYQNNIKQVSYDSGITWENVSPAEYSATTLIEQDSEYCGYVPPIKWIATYSGGTTSSAECSSSSAITNNEISVDGLLSVEIGNCVTTLGSTKYVQPPFENAISLTSVTFGQNVNVIGNRTFRNCSGLTSIDIPSSVTIIDNSVFVNCKSLSSVTIPDSVTELGDSAFQNCYNLTSVNIGTGITRIETFTFDNCSGLTSVTIPSSVTRIDEGAFQACKSLQNITIEATTPPILSGRTVFNNTNNCPIYVPCSSVADYKAASGWSNYASRIEGIPPCIPPFEGKWLATYTGGTTYSASCDGNVTLTSGNTRPNGYTYTAMTDAVIGNCVTGIGEDAFYNCKTLTSVTIPDSVTSIGWDAFGDCYSLTSVTIPDSVTSIGDYTFYNCNRLTSIIIPSGVTSIGEYIFYGCYGLTSVTIPDSVTSIGRYAFYWCTGLTSVTIPSGVTSIGNSAFRICSSLTSVTIPSSVTSIDIQAFRNCSSLTSITCLATAPAVLGSNAFDDTNNCPIYVPAEQVEEYKDIWRNYASRIQAIPNS